MSTKTSIKRIAAVAAVALTLGGFSAVSANAVTTPTFAIAGGSASSAATGTVATGTYQSVDIVIAANESAKVLTLTSTGVGAITVPTIAAGTDNVATANITTTGANFFGAHSSGDVIGSSSNVALGTGVGSATTIHISAYSATDGTQTITLAGSGSTVSATATLTWGAASGTVYNHSVVAIQQLSSAGTAQADIFTSGTLTGASSDASASAVAQLTISQFSSADTATAMTDAKATAVTVSVSGAGSVGIGSSHSAAANTRGPSATAAAAAASTHGSSGSATGTQTAYLFADGRAGTSTITVSVNGVVVSTKTFVFVGTPSVVKAVGNLKVLKAGGTVGTAAGNVYNGTATASDATTISGTTGTTPLTVFLTDANGNPAAKGTYVVKAKSSDTTVVASVSPCDVVDTGADAVVGELNCAVYGVGGAASGKTATVTVSLYKADGTTLVASADPVTFAIGGAIAKTVLSTDATDYTALAPIKVLVTSTDASGNAAYDQDVTAVGTIVSSIQLGGTLASPALIIGGVGSKKGAYAPAATYTGVTISGTDSTSAANAISTSFNVASPTDAASQAAIDAAQEATDAANAAYDAANNAMDSADAATAAAQDASDNASAALAAVTALSATVAKLVASVNSIAAALAKIQKKLKA